MRLLYKFFLPLCLAVIFLPACNKAEQNGAGDQVGTGGSLARFIITKNHLYVVDGGKMHTYSMADPANPQKIYQQDIGFNIETIYSWEDKLFVGSQDAIYVYSIVQPGTPRLLGSASHLRACDPVVANDSVAYVTVRTGNTCGGNVNALYVYSLKEVLNPVQTNILPLSNPHGLGLQQQTLYVCDGAEGLRVFDVSAAYQPIEVKQIKAGFFKDCIPYNNLLICMLSDGMALYDISNPHNPVLQATIKG